MRLEELAQGLAVRGVLPGTAVTVIAVTWHGPDAINLTYRSDQAGLGESVLYRADEANLEPAVTNQRPFDASADDVKLGLEAQRIRRAGLYDPMLAVATSAVTPLPHQIRAVYGQMLDQHPLRFLLADDPGAGKTIMAGLLIKELILREDVRRALIVAPGGLVDQWRDELWLKFGLNFDVLTSSDAYAITSSPALQSRPFLIARMDQLARNELLLEQLEDSEWDLVVVDEAHRMSARWYGQELKSTLRFRLGQLLGDVARHFLLMTATPHNGIEEDFQTFLSLLDPDEFAGRAPGGTARVDTSRVMRRMVKEELLTFDGTPLFPERVAQTVSYDLSREEQSLYDAVTEYVREGMGRADALEGKRRRTVGFALTVLQRRLASSPAAIHESLLRRAARLQQRADDLAKGIGVVTDAESAGRAGLTDIDRLDRLGDLEDDDELSAEESERIEDELVDSATAARTEAELRTEIHELRRLAAQALAVRRSGQDVKWAELRTILEGNVLTQHDGKARKVIVFTEHRDTLDYLVDRISRVLGDPEAVVAMHGGANRAERRRIAEEFTHNPDCRVLVATDAAGEGLNLQAAHLMVNYDLPWNPNRLEQRFGRIHRIGQTEVCRLWNLVAITTREGEVFDRLLCKVEEQRQAYEGKLFDVLGGSAFGQRSLRDLLIEAIRYGDQPAVRARMAQVVDAGVSQGLQELMRQSLARDFISPEEVEDLRRRMDEARARRLQPHYIQDAFRAAFERLGGRMARREKHRFEISRVPAVVRGRLEAIATRYERVTFEIEAIEHPGGVRAELLAPGHPLHDRVMELTEAQLESALERGTVLASPFITEPALLVGLLQEVVDGTGEPVDRRFRHAFVAPDGSVSDAGAAPYLDCATVESPEVAERARSLDWVPQAEERAVSWLVAHALPEHVREIAPPHRERLDATTRAVETRLRQEIHRLDALATDASIRESSGQAVRESSASLSRKAGDLEARMRERLALIERQRLLRTPPPRVVSASLVVPISWLDGHVDTPGEILDVDGRPIDTMTSARRGVDAALAAERALGREPEEMPHNNKGYDIRSRTPDGQTIYLEVKARVEGGHDFVVTHNEVNLGKNTEHGHRLVMVALDPRGPEHDRVRYLIDHFRGVDLGGLYAEKVTLNWDKTWALGGSPT